MAVFAPSIYRSHVVRKSHKEEPIIDELDNDKLNLLKDTQDLMVGDWVVAKRDIPLLGIRAGAGYKLLENFIKGSDGDVCLGIDVVPLNSYGDDENNRSYYGYTKYLKVYNLRDHNELGVIVAPVEIGLVSVKFDCTEAALLAIPGFFWVFVAMIFSNYYTERYRGSFLDAFCGT